MCFCPILGRPLGTEMFERQITELMRNQGKEELLFILDMHVSELYFRNSSVYKRPKYSP